MKIYPSNMNHLRYTKPTAQEIQEQYYFPCSITVLNLTTKIAEVFYYDGDGAECALGKTEIPSDYLIKNSLSKTDAAPTVIGLYPLKEPGIYPNLGNIDAQEGKLNFASFDGTTWSKVEVAMPNYLFQDKQYIQNGNVVLNNLGQIQSMDIKWADGVDGTLVNSQYNDFVLEYEKTTVTYLTTTILYTTTFDGNGNITSQTITIS